MEDPHAPMAHKPDELPVDSESTFAAPKVEAGTAKAEPENFRSSQRFSIREVFANEIPWSQRSSAQQWFPFRGMWHDLKRRAPYYLSDWSLALSPENLPRVVFSTIRMYALK